MRGPKGRSLVAHRAERGQGSREGDVPLPPARRYGEHCKLPQWDVGQNPGDLAIFVDSGIQEVILAAIQSESSSTK